MNANKCPKCQSEDVLLERWYLGLLSNNKEKWYYVCNNCETQTYLKNTQEEALLAWNRQEFEE